MREIKFFSAQWCGPCKAMRPLIKALEEDGVLVVAHIDIDEEKVVTDHHRVRGIPTLYWDKDNMLVGARSKEEIKTWLKELPDEGAV